MSALRNGLYRITYGIDPTLSTEEQSVVVVLRDGAIIGSDALGGVYIGEETQGPPLPAHAPARNPDTRRRMVVTCLVPPDGELVTGQRAGPDGASITITGSFPGNVTADANTPLFARVMVDRQPVEVEVRYLGALPI